MNRVVNMVGRYEIDVTLEISPVFLIRGPALLPSASGRLFFGRGISVGAPTPRQQLGFGRGDRKSRLFPVLAKTALSARRTVGNGDIPHFPVTIDRPLTANRARRDRDKKIRNVPISASSLS